MSKWQARFGLLLVAIIWAYGYIATDQSLRVMNIAQMQVLRFLIASVLLLVIFHKKLKLITRRTVIYGLGLGVLFFFGMSIHSYALTITTVSKNAFLVVTNVVFVPIILYIIFKTKFKLHLFVGIATMIIGFMFLVFKIDLFNLAASLENLKDLSNLNFGDYLTLLAAIIFASQIILIGYSSKKEDPILLNIFQMVIAFILSLIHCLVQGISIPLINMPNEQIMRVIIPIIYLGVAGCIGFTAQIIFQKYLSSSDSSLIFSTESLFAACFSVVLGLEAFSSSLLLGGILITIGIVYGETGFKFKEKDVLKSDEI
ncbi:MAG: DMT family transporter [Bacilli bacterium]|jgi:drug/metabolite transporter (DMT)-like permease|nr:DMT family transporter [Bacilli bacterium]